MLSFEQVSVVKKANVYFDGKCVSHTVIFPDGSRKSIGVIIPSVLLFNTGVAEVMELLDGECRVRLNGETAFKSYSAGQSFSVPANSSFEIDVTSVLHYVCHFS